MHILSPSAHSDKRSLLLQLLHDLGSDSVHVSNTFGGKGLAHSDFRAILFRFELDFANEASFLKLDEAEANVFACSLSEVFRAGAVILVSTIVFSETINTDLLSDV